MPPEFNKSHAAFTLIELLTVIAVIGLLAAILIPVLSGVRQRANESVAISNMRQIHSALLLKRNESGGRFPAIRNYDWDGPTNVEGELVAAEYPFMQEALAPYLEIVDGEDDTVDEIFRNPVVLANGQPEWLQAPEHTHFRYNVQTAPGSIPLDDGQAIVLFDVVWPDWPEQDFPYQSNGPSMKIVTVGGAVESLSYEEYMQRSGGAESTDSDFFARGWTR